LATGAPCRAGLDNGRGWFLTHRVEDRGFGAQHEADYWLEVAMQIGATCATPPLLRSGCTERDLAWAHAVLPGNSRDVRVAIHPGSGGYSLARRREPAKVAEVPDRLVADGKTVILVGGPNDGADDVLQHINYPVTNLVGRTTLGQLSAVLELCDYYIGADSGLLHLHNASNSQGFITGLFGPSNHLA